MLIDIAAVSETHLANEGQITEQGGGYTFSSDQCCEAGVGFAIENNIASKLNSLLKCFDNQLIALKLPLRNKHNIMLISTYATNPEEAKDQFYEELESLISAAPRSNKLLVLGDFNAWLGRDHVAWDRVIRHHRVGKCNNNSLLLLKTCAIHKPAYH